MSVNALLWLNAEAFTPLDLTSSGMSCSAFLTISSKPWIRPSGLGFWIVDGVTALE